MRHNISSIYTKFTVLRRYTTYRHRQLIKWLFSQENTYFHRVSGITTRPRPRMKVNSDDSVQAKTS